MDAEPTNQPTNQPTNATSAEIEKMRFESPDVVAQNVDRLGALFPTCVTETSGPDGKLRKSVNFDALRQLLDRAVVDDSREAYEFTWVGKKAALREANAPIRKTLRPCPEESKNWETTENLYIEGDNLDVLKLLQSNYLGKVKMIYIDPPYNTGNDFIYRDDFSRSQEEENSLLGYTDEDDNRLFKNTETNSRFHSDWCSMIYSRLLLARNLLRDDGVIFISIDDHEIDNVKKICGDVFGERNFVATFPWRKRTAKSDVPFGVSQDYEWIVCFAKTNKFSARTIGKERKYFETPDFPGRPWRVHDLTTQRTATERPNSNFTMINPKTGKQYPVNPMRTWAVTRETFEEYYAANRIVFPDDYEFLNISKPAFRYWKEDDEKKAGDMFGLIPVSTKLPDNVGMSLDGHKEITDLFAKKVFSYPKTLSLLKFLIDITTKVDKDAIILDFFSGSATTAHATLQLNFEDSGNRKFIMVQLNEECEEKTEAYKSGYKTICEIGKERIRRAGEKIKTENPLTTQDLDVGFRVLKVDESNMKNVYYHPDDLSQQSLLDSVDNIKEDRTDLDLLFGCVLDWGLELSRPYTSEKVGSYTIHNYDDGKLVACFDENVSEELVRMIAKMRPERVVFRDSSFKSAPEKINLFEIFKFYMPESADEINRRVRVL